MYQATTNQVKTSTNRDILELQFRVLSLYATNLSALGTQAALVAGFAFVGVTNPYLVHNH